MKKSMITAFFSVLLFVSYPILAEPTPKTIGISQIVEHPALDAVRQNMLKALADKGYIKNKNLTVIYDNAQGNLITSTQIATKLISRRPDVAIGISTPSAQGLVYEAKREASKTPIVFSAVSDPKAAGLEDCAACFVTGISDAPNLKALLSLIKTLMPSIKKLGVLYNPSESNSAATLLQLKTLLRENTIECIAVPVSKTQDISDATKSLIGKVDALYLPQDNTVVSAIQTIANIAAPHFPLFTNDPLLVEKGVLAAVGYDYNDVGYDTGLMVAKILAGATQPETPIQSPTILKTLINERLLKQWRLTLPPAKETYQLF